MSRRIQREAGVLLAVATGVLLAGCESTPVAQPPPVVGAADLKDPKKPHGKLRLMFEANPLAMVVEQAGGYASDGHGPILEIQPTDIHQRVPLFIGSKLDVETAEAFISGKH